MKNPKYHKLLTILLIAPHSLMLEITHIYVIRHRRIKLVPRLRPYWVVFMVLEGTLYIAGGDKKSSISPSYKPWDLHYWPANGITIATVAQMFWELPTTFCLDLRPIPWDAIHSWRPKVAKNLRLNRSWPSGKPNTIILLKEHRHEVTLHDILLYISTSFNLHEKGFLM